MKRDKKILFGAFLAVFMLVAISYASAVTSDTSNAERKESPLFGIRTNQAIREKISDIVMNIRTKFLGERIFFIPLPLIGTRMRQYSLASISGINPCITYHYLCSIDVKTYCEPQCTISPYTMCC